MAHEFNSNPGGAVRTGAGVRRQLESHLTSHRPGPTPGTRRRHSGTAGAASAGRKAATDYADYRAGPGPAPVALGGHRRRGPGRGRHRLVAGHQPALGVGRGGAVVHRAVDGERPAGDPQADGHLRRARVRPGLHPGPDAALRLPAAGLRVLDVLLDLPLHAAAGADAALVQPGLPVREDQPGHPLHGRPLLRGRRPPH